MGSAFHPPDDGGAEDPALPLSLTPLPASCLEIRLFYVRISPSPPSPPPTLTLSHIRRPIGSPLEINGHRLPPSVPHTLPLRRHPPDLTYVSTVSARLAGPAEFEVLAGEIVLLCGSIERVDPPWGADWALHCHPAASACFGATALEVEVYVAGCSTGAPLVLTTTVPIGGRRKPGRIAVPLNAIPEESGTGGSEEPVGREGLHCRKHNLQLEVAEDETDDYEAKLQMASGLYPDGMYYDEDGQLSWFNAGVRVGVGIGLGMCIGVGIGVGLLMRTYQATRNNFRRRFF